MGAVRCIVRVGWGDIDADSSSSPRACRYWLECPSCFVLVTTGIPSTYKLHAGVPFTEHAKATLQRGRKLCKSDIPFMNPGHDSVEFGVRHCAMEYNWFDMALG